MASLLSACRAACLLAFLATLYTPFTAAFAPSFLPASVGKRCMISSASNGATSASRSFFTGRQSGVTLRPSLRTSNVAGPRMALDVKVADLPNSQKKLEIEVSADECQNAFQAVLSKLSKSSTVPGFRKGKAPANVVLNHFGKKSVTAEACEEIIGASVPMALQQKDIKAIGQAKLADDTQVPKMLETFAPGKSVKFEVIVDVWPQPELKGSYTGMTVTAEEEAYEVDLVQNAVMEIRKRESFSVVSGADAVATVHPARFDEDVMKCEGAIAVVDLVGFRKNADGSKGDPLPDLAIGENVEVQMESGKFFPGFVEAIAGMKVGDTRTVPVTFPENHKVPELRGLAALFDVTIKALKDRMYPTLDDEFAAKVSDVKTMQDLRDKIRTSVTQEQLISTDKNINKALEDEIIKLIDIEIPETLIDEQTKTKFAQMMSDFKMRGMDDEQVKSMITKENFDKYKNKSRDLTERTLRVSFVIAEIARKEGIKVDPAEVEGEMVSLRQQYQGEEMEEEQAKNRVEAELERQKVLEFLKKNNTIKLVPKKAAEPPKA